MTWTFEERRDSGKFQVSDDGSARATLSLIATASNLYGETDPDLAPFGSSTAAVETSLVAALKANFPIGAAPTQPSGWTGEFHTTWSEEWRVVSYSGVIPKNSTGSVWYVDVSLAWTGDMTLLQGAYTTADRPRRDIEVLVSGSSRRAASYADWYSIIEAGSGLPSFGDADWSATDTSNIPIGSSVTRVDVNGSPIAIVIPQVKFSINTLTEWHPERANKIAANYIGQRNKEELFDWGTGHIVLDAVDMVEVAHGFQRLTLRMTADLFYHLEQEALTNAGDNGPIPLDTQTIATDYVIEHVRAVWRQPYGLTTDALAWNFEDLFYWDSGATSDYLKLVIPNE